MFKCMVEIFDLQALRDTLRSVKFQGHVQTLRACQIGTASIDCSPERG